MLNLILFCLLAISCGGMVFLAARKMPALASLCSNESGQGNGEQMPTEPFLAKEKAKLLTRKFLIIAAQKGIFFLRWLETTIKKSSEKMGRFYHRQRHQKNIQEDAVKKQEEIAKNADYWRAIRHTLVGRKKKEKIKKGSGLSDETTPM